MEKLSFIPESINKLGIPRCIKEGNAMRKIDLFEFGDASKKAYGACICKDGNFQSKLLCVKSNPLKGMIIIARLELCGALLVAQLCHEVCEALDKAVNDIQLWTDSIVLG